MKSKLAKLVAVLVLVVAMAGAATAEETTTAPASVEDSNAACAAKQPQKPGFLVWLLGLTAAEAEAECIDSGFPNDCSCIEACEEDCLDEWWNCPSDAQGSYADCDRALDACFSDCWCGQCACFPPDFSCYC